MNPSRPQLSPLKPCSAKPCPPKPSPPKHGGGLNQAVKTYKIDKSHWLDLSTGINPNSWPVPALPATVYNRLPEADDGLTTSARQYYQVNNLLPVAGSQQAIQLLPAVLKQLKLIGDQFRVGLMTPAYAEHEFAWRQANAEIIHLNKESIVQAIPELDILLLINPNNPDGHLFKPDTLLTWQQQLQKQGSLLIIDEAFIDCTPEYSLLSVADFKQMNNLIILRSIGKFFGLAGIRCGFVMAQQNILDTLNYYQGPWSLSHPTRYIARQALIDTQWIQHNRKLLSIQSRQLEQCLLNFLDKFDASAGLSGTRLFKTIFTNKASFLYKQLAQQGILTRLLDNNSGVRFGLPANEPQFQQLINTLDHITT